MKRLFALAIFFSATLLFMVQPLAGKILLPVLGGSPAVWSTCIVFFQAVLLLGYVYAHVLSTRVPVRGSGGPRGVDGRIRCPRDGLCEPSSPSRTCVSSCWI